MNHNTRKKHYSNDFRNMIVELYNSDIPVKTIHEEYDVPTATIYRWIKQINSASFNNCTSIIHQKYAELKKQNLKLKQENEILKKATAIYIKNS